MNNNFNENEITLIERYDKKLGKKVTKQFPVVGGRLRLFHEDVDKYDGDICQGVNSEVIRYENDIAVVKARVSVMGNSFTGIGMSSKSRDALIYPAILELAETRAIARALRFAGYGVEYTGAEEMPLDDAVPGVGEEEPNGNTSTGSRESAKKQPDPDPVEGSVSLKRQVWSLATNAFPQEDESLLAETLMEFINNIMNRYDDPPEVEKIYANIIKRPDEFISVIKGQLDSINPNAPESEETPETAEAEIDDPEKQQENFNRHKAKFDEAKKQLAESKVVKQPKDDSKERKAQAEAFRIMPDGVSVAAFNGTVDHLVECNEGMTKTGIYEMILEDTDTFIAIMKEWAEDNNIKAVEEEEKPEVVEPEVVDEAPKTLEDLKDIYHDESAEPKTPAEDIYSDFRKKWYNLRWKEFNEFILGNMANFRGSKQEYDAAVAKYDRLKVKNGCDGYTFPFPFDVADITPKHEAHLKDDRSIFTDGEKTPIDEAADNQLEELELGSKLAQLLASYPKMCQRAADASGFDLGDRYPSSELIKIFIEEFDHQVRTYEEKFNKKYTETKGG